MNHETLERFRRKLLGTRTTLLERRRQAMADEDELLGVREPDWEDEAAAVTAATVLHSIGEKERRVLARIQASLDRIDSGTYGECVDCRGAIGEGRLRAIPEADRCARCAARS